VPQGSRHGSRHGSAGHGRGAKEVQAEVEVAMAMSEGRAPRSCAKAMSEDIAPRDTMRERWPELFMSDAEIAEADWEQAAQRSSPDDKVPP
jgi:hypothetical protein